MPEMANGNHCLMEKTSKDGSFMVPKSGMLKMDFWFVKAGPIRNMAICPRKNFTTTLSWRWSSCRRPMATAASSSGLPLKALR